MKPLITAFLLIFSTGTALAAEQLLDRIIAIVDEDVITQVELEQRIRDIQYQLQTPVKSEAEFQALTRQVLEKMVRDKIQLQMAAKLGIKIDDVTLNRVLEQLAANNRLTLQQLRATLEKDGLNFERFREQTRDELIIKQLQQRMVANRINVSDQEIARFIEENNKQAQSSTRYHLRHILIATPESAKPEQVQQARQKAQQLYKKIQAGTDFAELAIQHSSGRNALKGGDLGWRSANELPEDFVAKVRQLQTGETTTPIRSASGFHLLQLLDQRNEQNTVIQTHARHILIKDDDDSARERLAELKRQIEQGADFAELARKYSQDPGSGSRGGDLGWADPSTFVPAFESVMQTLDEGEISEPFKSHFGWHIMQVLERREQAASHDMLAEQARKQIRNRKIDEELRLWLRKIRDEAYVEIIPLNGDSAS